MKKCLLLLITLCLFTIKVNAQTFSQTFIDKCTGERKVATTTMMNGFATVSFYNQVRTFSPLEVQSGVVQSWLLTTKATYEALTCPVINNPIVQQAVTNAAAQTATNAAAAAASSAASSAASGAASSSASSAASSSASSAATSSTPPPPPSSSGGSSQSKTETKTETKSESKTESKTESKSESKSEEKKSESKSEEKKEESKSEEKKEEKKEESKEEKKEEEKKEEKKKERKVAPSNPMLLSSDLSTIESPDGRWLQSATVGVSRSSLMGDKSYSANAVIMSDLKTFIVSGGYTKMDFSEGKLKTIHSYSSSFAYLNGNYMNILGYTWIKPTQKQGVFGYNVGLINLLLGGVEKNEYTHNMSTSVVMFWTKPYQYSKKLSISPQIFTMFAPISYNSPAKMTTVNRHMGFLLGSSFDYKLSKRFGLSVNYKLSGNTQPGSPFLSNILIGSRMIL